MHARTVLVFVSGCVVYAAMAACSSSNSGGSGGAGTAGAAASGGGSGAGTMTSGAGAGSTGPGTTTSSTGTSTGPGGGTGQNASGSRLKRSFGLGDDGADDLELIILPWVDPVTSNETFRQRKPGAVWWDDQRQEKCAYRAASDDSIRCLPIDAVEYVVAFSDAACTQRAIGLPAAAPGCPQTAPGYAYETLYPPATCPFTGYNPIRIYPIGSFLGPNLTCYQKNASGTCKVGQCGSGTNLAVYAVGAAVGPSSFVAGTPGQDP